MIPLAPQDITAAWVSALLERHGAPPGSVADVAVEPLGGERGFVGQTLRLRLHGQQGQPVTPPTLVAKLPPASERALAALAPLRYGEREVRFYRELASTCPLPTPRCFFADFDPATGNAVLVLEDLSAYEPGDDVAGCPPAQAAPLVQRLAAFHAQRWGQPRSVLPWLPRFTEDQPDALYERLWRVMRWRHKRVMPPAFVAIGDELGRRLPAFRKRMAQPPCTVVHGDLRADNMLFGPGGAWVLDWQSVAWARGGLDLGYLLTQSLAPEQRRALEVGLAAAYHAALVAGGVRGFSIDDVWEDYRLGCLHNAATFVLAGASLDFSGPRAQRLLSVSLERITAAVGNHRPFELLAD